MWPAETDIEISTSKHVRNFSTSNGQTGTQLLGQIFFGTTHPGRVTHGFHRITPSPTAIEIIECHN